FRQEPRRGKASTGAAKVGSVKAIRCQSSGENVNIAKTPSQFVGEQPFDLGREKELAEIILASRDMMYVLQLLHDFPPGEQDDPKSILASAGVITAYCRPFTRNNRGRVVGAKWVVGFDQGEMA